MHKGLLTLGAVLALAAPTHTVQMETPVNDLRNNWHLLADWAELQTPVFLNETFEPRTLTKGDQQKLLSLSNQLSSTYEMKEDWHINEKDNVLVVDWYAVEKATGEAFCVYSETVELPSCDGVEDM